MNKVDLLEVGTPHGHIDADGDHVLKGKVVPQVSIYWTTIPGPWIPEISFYLLS